MNIAALPIDSPVESDITQISFWKLLDIDATISGSMKQMKESHNALLPSAKGRIRSPEYTTAKILIYLMAHEMEHLRLSKPEVYKMYLSDEVDYLPVSTNRGQLRTMMDDEYSIRSYSNFIDRLLDSQIILRKRNTSRLREKVVDDKGKVHQIIRLAPNGRGDFVLHINKKALTFSPIISPLQPRQTSSGNEKSADNQSVTSPQVQNLQQPHSFETIKINTNNRGNVENDSAAPRQSMISLRNLLRNEGIRNEGNRNAGVFKDFLKLEKVRYLKKLEKENRLQRKIPVNQKDYFATLLYFQMKNQVYPNCSASRLSFLEPHIKNMLRLHLQRLDMPLAKAFDWVSRAIYLAGRHLRKNSNAYVYAPLTWLRIDDEYKSGTLKTIIDEWIPREEKRLLVYRNQKSDFVKWQYAVRYVDKVFLKVVIDLKKGFNSGVYSCKNGLKQIESLFEKYDLPESTRKQLRKRYVERVYHVTNEMNQLSEPESDPIWMAFQRFRNKK